MKQQTKRVSHWKLMMVGTTSLVGRRLFVAALALVSLAVWTMTVVGSGILHGRGVPQAALAAAPLNPTQMLQQVQTLRAAAPGSATVSGAELVPVEMPSRDPFTPAESWFPKPKVGPALRLASGSLKDGGVKEPEAAPDEATLSAGDLAALQVEGTLVGSDKVAVVSGNSLRIGGQLKVLVAAARGKAGGVAAAAPGASSRLRVGDEVEIRPVAVSDGRYRLNDLREILRVKDITHRGVTFALGDKEYILEMGK